MGHRKETEQILKKMTLEEKAAILSGKNEWESLDIPRLGVPSVVFSDGPSGVRRQMGKGDHLGLNASVPATCFPSSAAVANSWDPALAQLVGQALGAEAAALGVGVLLGPGMNIKRNPLCGRNFEYFSEDPLLSGKMAAGYVRGIQENGIFACIKHFAVNSQEQRRMAMNAVLDERTLREIYLTGFEIAIEEGKPGAVMTSYNEVNGEYANENTHLLKEILRGEWGYQGLVVTDWGGSNDHTAGVKAGSDIEMPAPGYGSARELLQSIRDGRLQMEELDERAATVLDTALALPYRKLRFQYDKGAPQDALSREGKQVEKKAGKKEPDFDFSHRTARKAARESIVLLKNKHGILPLDQKARTAVIGDFAREPRYQGAGSSCINSVNLESVFSILNDFDLNCISYTQGYRRNSQADEALEKKALETANSADVVLYFFGLDEISESEGMDRLHMRIPENQIRLLQKLKETDTAVIGILCGGSAVEMPWIDCLDALLYVSLGGEAGASACLDVITGRENPSGKLAETYPVSYSDTATADFYGKEGRDALYREGIYVGYRYYEKAGIPVRFPFGYGLSYTTFSYSDLTLTEDGAEFTVANTGDRAGAEVAQLYIGSPCDTVFFAEKELKGFQKVYLMPKESRRITIPFDKRTFRYWNQKTERWEEAAGTYRILIGSSSQDIRLEAQQKRRGTTAQNPYEREKLPSYYTGKVRNVDEREFERLLGHELKKTDTSSSYLTINDAFCQMGQARSLPARMVYRILNGRKERSEREGKPNLNVLFIYNMPFRALAKMTAGAVSMEMADGITEMVNGHFFRGAGKVIGGYFRNARANKAYEKKLRGAESGEQCS